MTNGLRGALLTCSAIVVGAVRQAANELYVRYGTRYPNLGALEEPLTYDTEGIDCLSIVKYVSLQYERPGKITLDRYLRYLGWF